MWNLFKKKDPICGMTEEKGNGTHKDGRWFCSEHCLKTYEKGMKSSAKSGCCHR